MKVSLIIPTYKDPVALKLILDALKCQTYKNFEVIVAEDDNAVETKILLEGYNAWFNIKHYSHDDIGNRKPKAVNSSIGMSEGEYIIFIDGDTIPFSTFISSHVFFSSPGRGLCGRRVNLGKKVSDDLRGKKITALQLEKKFLISAPYLLSDNIRHYEQGLYFGPSNIVGNFLRKIDKNIHIVASNFSCYKSDLLKVNGIDEDLPFAPSRDDTDLEWRLEAIGVELSSVKYSANLFHLHHTRSDRSEEDKKNREIIKFKQKNNLFRCENGITKAESAD